METKARVIGIVLTSPKRSHDYFAAKRARFSDVVSGEVDMELDYIHERRLSLKARDLTTWRQRLNGAAVGRTM